MRNSPENQNQGRTFSCPYRVCYSDCTLGNHVYYSRFLEMMEMARGEFHREIGHPLIQLQGEEAIFPVLRCGMQYLRPARYDDVLSIRLWLSQLSAVRFRMEYEIVRDEQGLVRGWTEHVCTSLQERPKRIPGSLADALRHYLQPAPTEN